MVEKTAFSILLSGTDDPAGSQPTDEIKDNIQAFLDLHPGWTHTLLNEPKVEAFLKDNFDPSVLEAYHHFRPYAYRSDLVRYCLIYLYGGIYFDVAIRYVEPMPIEEGKVTVFRDIRGTVPYEIFTGHFYAPAGHPFLKACYEACVRHAQTEFYGINPIAPTGPVIFGKYIGTHVEPEECYNGEAHYFPRAYENFFTHPGCPYGMVAYRRKKGAGISSMGVARSNNYHLIWATRSVYGFRTARRFEADELVEKGHIKPDIVQEGGEVVVTPDHQGHSVGGFRLYLTPGTYVIGYELYDLEPTGVTVQELMSREANFREPVVYDNRSFDKGDITLIGYFNITEPAHDYTLMLHGNPGKSFKIRAVTVKQID